MRRRLRQREGDCSCAGRGLAVEPLCGLAAYAGSAVTVGVLPVEVRTQADRIVAALSTVVASGDIGDVSRPIEAICSALTWLGDRRISATSRRPFIP